MGLEDDIEDYLPGGEFALAEVIVHEVLSSTSDMWSAYVERRKEEMAQSKEQEKKFDE